ncbi:hypothetical protein [Mycolicibacterium neoaurum]|uniref:hypothetical protein n=1 Tax=Mycolicibacterium neoaurum TaxID=1795 RepID=UPI001F4CB3C0|nr:hypothetical protein [Mycolicibacterium neoaurum]
MKRGSPWTAPAMPEIRAALRRGFIDMIERHSEALVDDPDLRSARNPAQLRRRNNLARDLAAALDEMRTEVKALDRSALYWVARDMVPVVMSAAESLPEWTPDLAMPSEAGMLCWAKPAGDMMFHDKGAVPWDGAWWWRRPDGLLQIQLASRLTQRQDLLVPFGISTPLWSGTTLLVNPDVPRTAEVHGDPDASQMVRILGATWLLMDQRTVAEVRTLPAPSLAATAGDADTTPSLVSMVELRRKLPESHKPTTSSGVQRKYHSRWDVEGHWRQQACGPRWSQRKPIYITDYTKGPEGAPLKSSKVHVLRR